MTSLESLTSASFEFLVTPAGTTTLEIAFWIFFFCLLNRHYGKPEKRENRRDGIEGKDEVLETSTTMMTATTEAEIDERLVPSLDSADGDVVVDGAAFRSTVRRRLHGGKDVFR